MSFLPRRLHNRMLVAITLVMLSGTLGLSFWTAASQSGQLHVARLQQAKLLSHNLAEGCAHALSIEDYAALDQFLRNASGVPGLRKVVALDASGAILTVFKRTSDTDHAELIDEHEVLKAPATIQQTEQTSGTKLVIWQPVQAGGLLGWLQLTFSHDDIAQLQRQVWQNGIIAAFGEVALGICLVGLLLRRPLRSISSLSSFARELPLHKGATVPVERSVSEVQDLGESLNYASTELNRIEHELLELNRTLEARVEDELTKSREKDALLLQQARYQTLGELLVNIAHHWRQPLNNIGVVVQENAWLIANGELPPASAMQAAEQAVQELKQLSRSIEGFQLLCKPADPSGQLLPSEAVQRAILMVQEGYRQSGISFELQVRAEHAIGGSLQDLVQCLLNLFSNARDAIVAQHEPGGRIMVCIDLPHENALQISVSDNGGGIPPALMHSVFDPYVTSKFRAQGVGLGLFVVRQIIEQRFQGSVSAGNHGAGAVITLELPLKLGERYESE